MAALKFLVDTNVFIELEDPKIVSPVVADLAQKAQLYSVTLFLHEASRADVARDTDPVRRLVSQSKLRKFPTLTDVAHRGSDELEKLFGPVRTENDRCDVLMLDALELGVVDFLITEDAGIYRRAARANLQRRVFKVREALTWLQRTFEPKEFRLPYIESRKAHQVSLTDTLFDTLRQDYPGFDRWFAQCRRAHRDCWTVEVAGELAGLVIRKDETRAEAGTVRPGHRILKICTFKMKQDHQGEKFGEQLLKKILWFAQTNAYEVVYLTVFPKHEFLIDLIGTFGFECTRTLPNGELFMERVIALEDSLSPGGRGTFETDLRLYPRFCDGHEVDKFIVPIQPPFHAVLFPEIADLRTLPLFPDEPLSLSIARDVNRTPGNTIRKVYVCRSPTRTLRSGDVLLFYLSKSDEFIRSQSVTTVGVVESVRLAESGEELIRLVGRRSVYSQESLEALRPSSDSPVLVIDFLLNGHLDPPVGLEQLLGSGAFSSRPPQSIKRVSESAYSYIRSNARLSFE